MNISKQAKTIIKSISVIILYYIFYNVLFIIMKSFGLNINEFSMLQKVITFFVLDSLLVILLWLIYRRDLKREFILFKDNFKKFIEKYTKYWLLGIVLMSVMNMIITYIVKSDIASNEEVVRSLIEKFPLYGLFSACIIAPFTEEIIFRKTFKDVIKNKYVLIITCGFIFGLIHVLGTYESISDFLYIFSYGIFGAIFAYIYYKTDTVFVPMFFHFIHNTLLVLVFIITNSWL